MPSIYGRAVGCSAVGSGQDEDEKQEKMRSKFGKGSGIKWEEIIR